MTSWRERGSKPAFSQGARLSKPGKPDIIPRSCAALGGEVSWPDARLLALRRLLRLKNKFG
jgi:hypothetical protein